MTTEFDNLLRERMQRLADHAPTTVRTAEEIRVVASPVRSPRRRNRVGIVATIALVAGGAGLTGLALQGAADGGAATPVEAVQQLADALQREDVLGMIDQLDPTEVPIVRNAFQTLDTDAKRTKLVDDQFRLGAVKGLDVYVEGLRLDTESVSNDVTVVRATAGTFSTSFDPAAFPLGDAIRHATTGTSLEPTTVTADLATAKVMAATVQRDGRWYVSISYTIAEYARQAAKATVPDPTSALKPEGFATPEAATTALYQRLISFDMQGAAATVAPGEGDAFLRYASLWLPQTQAAADRARQSGSNLTVSGLTFTTTSSGDQRTVAPQDFVIDGTIADSWNTRSETPLNPTLPTVIFPQSSGGYFLVPAGVPIPATTAGLSPAVDPAAPPPQNANVTSADADGTVHQLPKPVDASQVETPLALHIEHSNGCVTWSGAGADRLGFGSALSRGSTTLVDGSRRTCGESSRLGLVGLVSLIGLGGWPGDLPAVATTRVGDQWYVSPLGTALASMTDLLHSPADGSSLFDSPIGIYLYGANREMLQGLVDGGSPPTPECEAIVDRSGGAPRVIADPTIAQARACLQNQSSIDSTQNIGATATVTATSIPAPAEPAIVEPVGAPPGSVPAPPATAAATP